MTDEKLNPDQLALLAMILEGTNSPDLGPMDDDYFLARGIAPDKPGHL